MIPAPLLQFQKKCNQVIYLFQLIPTPL
jgi:hypothetical protein